LPRETWTTLLVSGGESTAHYVVHGGAREACLDGTENGGLAIIETVVERPAIDKPRDLPATISSARD
jgi:hypothetical protein